MSVFVYNVYPFVSCTTYSGCMCVWCGVGCVLKICTVYNVQKVSVYTCAVAYGICKCGHCMRCCDCMSGHESVMIPLFAYQAPFNNRITHNITSQAIVSQTITAVQEDHTEQNRYLRTYASVASSLDHLHRIYSAHVSAQSILNLPKSPSNPQLLVIPDTTYLYQK